MLVTRSRSRLTPCLGLLALDWVVPYTASCNYDPHDPYHWKDEHSECQATWQRLRSLQEECGLDSSDSQDIVLDQDVFSIRIKNLVY